ncbi:toxin-antitoxin system YwqK family antitoxin [Helicobacter bilis]|nr:toxin-antitoxin system YwqK family antitoxin [Helicobacter bilis]MCI7410245.1 toxin-antitoxin system YwqK family antitoxin [Helicobacter bilis]MDD7296965.1 toxin-antitoxin system YwqK family antitoxin [Helicobacter bilis]MDY4400168.1 toxin-antitoxin system YwqK family antitoxin [Helicobacter bilis]
MINFKKMAIGFGLVSIITLQGLQANKPPECRFFFPYTKNDCVDTEYDSNGNIWRETPYKDGKLNGIVKKYDINGKLSMERPYKNGELDGIEKVYYENGKLESETPYKNGKAEGIKRWYYENGNIKQERTYIKGRRHEYKFYTEDGNFLGAVRYRNEMMIEFVKCPKKKLSNDETESVLDEFMLIEGSRDPGADHDDVIKEYCEE